MLSLTSTQFDDAEPSGLMSSQSGVAQFFTALLSANDATDGKYNAHRNHRRLTNVVGCCTASTSITNTLIGIAVTAEQAKIDADGKAYTVTPANIVTLTCPDQGTYSSCSTALAATAWQNAFTW